MTQNKENIQFLLDTFKTIYSIEKKYRGNAVEYYNELTTSFILCAVKLRHLWRRYKAETATPFLNLLENNYLLFFLLYV